LCRGLVFGQIKFLTIAQKLRLNSKVTKIIIALPSLCLNLPLILGYLGQIFSEVPQIVSYNCTYRVFHGFGQAKIAYGGSILGSSQFALLPQLPPKIMLGLKVVKIDSK